VDLRVVAARLAAEEFPLCGDQDFARSPKEHLFRVVIKHRSPVNINCRIFEDNSGTKVEEMMASGASGL